MFVKICGITTREALAAAVSAGADAVGFVFADSPRRISPERAAELCRELPAGIARIAVMHHPDPATVTAVLTQFRPDWLQTDAEDFATIELPPDCRPLPVYRNGRLPGGELPERIVFEGAISGTGTVADWDEARALAGRTELILAGGLDAANVGAAIGIVRPWGVDVSSGVESSRGVKDPQKIAEFVARVRAVEKKVMSELQDSPEALLQALIEGRLPDGHGRYGPYGGQYIPETLMPAVSRLAEGVRDVLPTEAFQRELNNELKTWIGRPTALTHAPRLGARWGADVWFKREDLAHTGAHKINNAIGQALLAKALGAKRIVAETGAGQHGVASAAACARVGLPCVVYMGEVDVARQAPNVDRMRRLGAKVVAVKSGDRTLRAAIDEAIRDWVSDPLGTYYLIGSAIGPHPYPTLVRILQSVIGKEARAQMVEAGGLPDAAFACVGGGSNAIGLFHGFLADRKVALYGVEAGGRGSALGEHSATIAAGRPGVLHGNYSMLLYDEDGLIQETHSVSAGLDYPGVGPEHSLLKDIGRVSYVTATDDEALAALDECCANEGILPALESAHALAGAKRWAAVNPGRRILIGMSGRGDKDMPILAQHPRKEEATDAAS